MIVSSADESEKAEDGDEETVKQDRSLILHRYSALPPDMSVCAFAEDTDSHIW